MKFTKEQIEAVIAAMTTACTQCGEPPTDDDMQELRADPMMVEGLIRFARIAAADPVIASIAL